MNSILQKNFPDKLIPFLLKAEQDIYLVGGAVRDLLLGKISHDFDFVVTGDVRKIAKQVANLLNGDYYMLDNERNTARVLSRGNDGAGYIFDFARMRGETLEQDLRERDFTINAMALNLQTENIIDPCHGAMDLKNKYLKACSIDSLQSDPVRILRAVRFSTQFNLTILPDLISQMRSAAATITNVSWERIRDELVRILSLDDSSKALRILGIMDLIQVLFPEISELAAQKWEKILAIIERLETLFNLIVGSRKPDQGEHLIAGLVVLRLGRYRMKLQSHYNECITPDRSIPFLLKLAVLLTQLADSLEQETIREFIENKGKQLVLSGNEINRLISIADAWQAVGNVFSEYNKLEPITIYRFFSKVGLAGIDACLLAIAESWSASLFTLDQDAWDDQLQIYQELFSSWWEQYDRLINPPQLVNGNDLILKLSLTPGPDIGKIIEVIREAQVAQGIKTKEEAIHIAQSWLETNKSLKMNDL